MGGKNFDDLFQEKPSKLIPEANEYLGACASSPEPKGWPGLYVLNGKQNTRGFQYVHLGFASYTADGKSFVFEFNEPEKWRLTVRGRKLWKIFVNIHHHALEWIKKADRDFEDGNHPIITDIRIDRVSEASEESEDS